MAEPNIVDWNIEYDENAIGRDGMPVYRADGVSAKLPGAMINVAKGWESEDDTWVALVEGTDITPFYFAAHSMSLCMWVTEAYIEGLPPRN